MCFDFLCYNFWLKHFSFEEAEWCTVKKMYTVIHWKYPLFLPECNGNWIFSTDFLKKNSRIKFHLNPSSRSRVVPCGRMNTTKLMAVLSNVVNAPKNWFFSLNRRYVSKFSQTIRTCYVDLPHTGLPVSSLKQKQMKPDFDILPAGLLTITERLWPAL
jgi:hypothetical protein